MKIKKTFQKPIKNSTTMTEILGKKYFFDDKLFLYEVMETLIRNLDIRTINSKDFRNLLNRVITIKPTIYQVERMRLRFGFLLFDEFPELFEEYNVGKIIYIPFPVALENLKDYPSYEINKIKLFKMIRDSIYVGMRKKSQHFWDYE